MDDSIKLLIPIVVGIFSWFIKNFIFNLIAKRNELIHKEWECRLKEIWSPLYYWSGILLLNKNNNINKEEVKYGLREFQDTLSKAAYVLPKEHFYTLIKLVEFNTKQNTKPIPNDEYLKTRKYIYNQIELLNYLLYRSSEFDDVSVKTNLIYPYKYLLRMITISIAHILIWILIITVIYLLYWSFNYGHYWALGFVALILIYLMHIDIKQRKYINEEINKRL